MPRHPSLYCIQSMQLFNDASVAKMRKETLDAYKQAFLVPTKLSERKAVYLSRETQERADFIVRRLGDRGSNLSSFVENIVRIHLGEYGEDIEKWRKL